MILYEWFRSPSVLYFEQSSCEPLFLYIITKRHIARLVGTVSLSQTFLMNPNSRSLVTVDRCHTSVGIPSGPGDFDFFMLSTASSNSYLVITAFLSLESDNFSNADLAFSSSVGVNLATIF